MDITTEPCDKGVYVIRRVGRQQWAEGDGTWQAHGVRLELMDGAAPIATCTLEVAGTVAAEERGADAAQAIEPWVPALRHLRTAAASRDRLQRARSLHTRIADLHADRYQISSYERETLYAMASGHEVTAEQAANPPRWADVFEGDQDLAIVTAMIKRLTVQAAQEAQRGYALAPDPAAHPIHPAWELPRLAHSFPAESLTAWVARGLLAGWAAVREDRDRLITWAVQDGELTSTEVQRITSVSRSTIARLLPGSGD
ncbi:hypothetical protein AB0F09_19115 [Streptomyces olivaceus]|uniref:hypothetical protein n=1 Tax=Streptomyces olivaceus TaxID=47716 RepID=UPI0033CE1F6B